MSENSFKSIRNGAIASVIAGIILLAVPVLRGSVVSFFFMALVWSSLVLGSSKYIIFPSRLGLAINLDICIRGFDQYLPGT